MAFCRIGIRRCALGAVSILPRGRSFPQGSCRDCCSATSREQGPSPRAQFHALGLIRETRVQLSEDKRAPGHCQLAEHVENPMSSSVSFSRALNYKLGNAVNWRNRKLRENYFQAPAIASRCKRLAQKRENGVWTSSKVSSTCSTYDDEEAVRICKEVRSRSFFMLKNLSAENLSYKFLKHNWSTLTVWAAIDA